MSGSGIGTPVLDMSFALDELIGMVNDEVDNHPIHTAVGAEGDGETTAFHIAPTSRYVVDDSSFVPYVGGIEVSSFAMDFDSGDITFPTAPADLASIWVQFSHTVWTDAMVGTAIDAAVAALFPAFYRSSVETVAANGSDRELSLTTEDVECIRQVESSSTLTGPWTAISRNKYDRYMDGDTRTIRFFSPPPSGYIRAHLICRPALVDQTGLNVPDRAIAPIISYACYYLLTQKMAQRVRSDTAANTYGSGTLSPRQMNDASNAFYLRYQMQLATTKMRPWSGV